MRFVGTVELTKAVSGAMVGVGDGAGTEVVTDEEMNEDFTMKSERALQTALIVDHGEASRTAVALHHALQRHSDVRLMDRHSATRRVRLIGEYEAVADLIC